jgi:hypothetical protein
VYFKDNVRRWAEDLSRKSTDRTRRPKERQTAATQSRRAQLFDQRLREAKAAGADIRIIVVDGQERSPGDLDEEASKVARRLLDPKPWRVSQYDDATGEFVLRRGGAGRGDGTWLDEELRAVVSAYTAMQAAARTRATINSGAVIDGLSGTLGRPSQAVADRMGDVSTLLSLLGRDWIAEVAPNKDVDPAICSRLASLLAAKAEIDLPEAAERIELKRLATTSLDRPDGVIEPERTATQTTTFVRDVRVKAWVLKRAAGTCECCRLRAPFCDAVGEPYLEVHHVRRLADGGSDTISNAAALCPNCHRELHYGRDAHTKRADLLKNVAELVPE